MLELAVIRWECALRIFSNRPQESNLEMIESVLSSWPHQLSFPLNVIGAKLSRFLNSFQKKAYDKKFVQTFLLQFGDDQLAHFRQVILQFRSDPVPTGQFYLLFSALGSQILIDFIIPASKQIAVNSLSSQRKRRQMEESNEEDDALAGPSLPKRVSADKRILPRSCNSKSAAARVEDVRFVKMLKEKSKRIGTLEEIGLYAVPLKKSSTQIGPATLNRFVFDVETIGENGPSLEMDTENKTILLVGAPDSGKTFINSILNFVVGVNRNDPFRFLLKEDGQEETISIYDLSHADGFRIPFSLTIVEVPYCVDKPSKDFAEMLGTFLQSDAIQKLDLIGLVSPANILPRPSYESILYHFGKNIEEKIHFIQVDSSEANTFLESLHRLKFQNLDISAGGHNSRTLRWKSFQNFVQSLAEKTPRELSQSIQVLEERRRLELTIEKLRKVVEKGTALREEIVESNRKIAEYETKIREKIFDIKTTRKTNLEAGFLATNCNNCLVTCSIHQQFETKTSSCSECPEKCNWNLHSINMSYRWECTIEDVKSKLDAEKENQKKLISEERNTSINQKVIRPRVNVYIEELDKIALYPFLMTPEFAALMA